MASSDLLSLFQQQLARITYLLRTPPTHSAGPRRPSMDQQESDSK